MIISADCIEGTSGPTESTRTSRVKKKKSSSTRNVFPGQSEHIYKISKNLTKLSNNKTEVTWKCLLNEVLKLHPEVNILPSHIVLISKLNDLTINERDQYNFVCNEEDFVNMLKIAKEKKCSFSIIVKYLKNEVFENSERSKQKYIDDLLKPNSIHMAINIFTNSYATNCQMNKGMEMFPLNAVKNVVSVLQGNLSKFESYLNSFVASSNTNVSHPGYLCDHCDRDIVGIRYRCTVCANFDLCELCEAFSEQVHDNSHLFLKIRRPIYSTYPKESFIEASSNEPLITADVFIDLNSHLSECKTTSIDVKEVTSSQEEQLLSSKIKIKNKTKTKTNKTKHNENTKTAKKVYNVEAGSKITKIWKIRNNGTSPWTPQLTLRRISGNIEPIEEQYSLAVPLLKPGEEDVISITFKIPPIITEETDFFSVWRFCYKEKIFGKPLNLNVTVRPSTGEGKSTSSNAECDGLHFSDNENNLSDSEASVVYPPCFNLDVPFLRLNTSNTQLNLDKMLADRKIEIDPIKIDKKIDYNCPHSESYLDSTSDSADNSIAFKLKTRKLKEAKSSKRECKIKKPLKTIKSSSIGGKVSGDLLIPVPSSSIIEKIKSKNKNETSVNCESEPIRNLNSKSDVSNQKCPTSKANSKKPNPNLDNLKTPKMSKTSSSSSTSSNTKGRNEKPKNAFDQFGNILPNVSRTFSNFCNMLANPGPSHLNGPNSTTNNNRNMQSETLKNALQKLFEMGFCNETLNVELLIKNNFDIQRTVHELFFSIGNNLFSGVSPEAASQPATSASPSANTSAGSPPNGQKPESSFSVDCVD